MKTKLAGMVCVGAMMLPAMMQLGRGGYVNPNAKSDVLSAAVATFSGTFRGVTKGKLMLEVEEGKVVTLLVNKKTEIRAGGKAEKPLKLKQLNIGDLLSAEAASERGELIAVRVVLRESGQPPPASRP